MAAGSVTELVEAVRKPLALPRARALSESTNRPLMRKSAEGGEAANAFAIDKKPPARRHSHAGTRRTSSMQCISELPEQKKPKKPNRRLSFMAG